MSYLRSRAMGGGRLVTGSDKDNPADVVSQQLALRDVGVLSVIGTVTNTFASNCYVQLYDKAGTPTAADKPLVELGPIATTGSVEWVPADPDLVGEDSWGYPFDRGLFAGLSTTKGSYSAAGNGEVMALVVRTSKRRIEDCQSP